jgi:hypothetical protein
VNKKGCSTGTGTAAAAAAEEPIVVPKRKVVLDATQAQAAAAAALNLTLQKSAAGRNGPQVIAVDATKAQAAAEAALNLTLQKKAQAAAGMNQLKAAAAAKSGFDIAVPRSVQSVPSSWSKAARLNNNNQGGARWLIRFTKPNHSNPFPRLPFIMGGMALGMLLAPRRRE